MVRNHIGKPPPIDFSQSQREGIFDEDLVAGRLLTYISPFAGSAVGAAIKLWIGSVDSEEAGKYLDSHFEVKDIEDPVEVYFTKDELLAYNNQRNYFGYNVDGGELSSTVPIDVALSEAKRK